MRQPGGISGRVRARGLAAELFSDLARSGALARATGLTGNFLITSANCAAADGAVRQPSGVTSSAHLAQTPAGDGSWLID